MSANTMKPSRPAFKTSKKRVRKAATPQETAQVLRERKAMDTGSSELERYFNAGNKHFGM